jgi:colicin import membrane protein
MAREENSLLFSLKELHNLEEDRIRDEANAKQAAIDAERRAKEDAVRQAKEAEEARIRAAEDAARREREERERKEREDRIRVEETERRARIEAQARIEEAQIRAATEAIKNKPLPVKLIAAVSAVLIAFSIGVVTVVKRNQEVAKKEAIAAAAAAIQAERKRDQDEQARLQQVLAARMAEMTKLDNALKTAMNEKERQEIAKAAGQAAERARQAASDAEAQRKAAKEREKKAKFERCKNSDDPLCGT